MIDGRYELDHEIGRGGMGSVWLARDIVLGRVVAMKQIGMMPGGAAPDLDRAEREARLTARINHQNVVAVFDLVDHDGHQWLVMEHVDGRSLAELIAERGPLSPDEAAPVVEQVAAALAAAHEHGIVHRDVKPSNILLTHDGVAKLSDFGVARGHADVSLTQTGLVTGSPAYVAPEVVTGSASSPASDVWSLGATLFHALSGHAPYAVGDDLLGTMHRIVDEEPPRLADGGPLAALVTAMMQRDPAARPTMPDVERSAAALHDPAAPTVEDTDLEATQGFAMFADTAPLTPPASPPSTPPSSTPPSSTPTPTPTAVAPLPERPDSQHRAPTGRRGGGRWVWLVVAVAAVVLAVLVIAIVSRRDSGDPAPRTGSASTATDEATPAAQALEDFAVDYLKTADDDPEAGFAMLTPDYQRESGGFDGYNGFWGNVSNLDVGNVQGDPKTLRVSYTYSYDDADSGSHTEDVTLQLVRSGDTFLISGDS